MALETFKKLPLGGVDRHTLVRVLAEQGEATATELLRRQIENVRPAGTSLAGDAAVILLGGSNGILRQVAIQLLFGEGATVYGVHYDSEKMQIGHYHVQALSAAAASRGLVARYWNMDATRPASIQEVVDHLAGRHRYVHLINGIAAGATKRYAEHGAAKVKEIDVAFHPVLQVPDFSSFDHLRKVGWVDVEVANEIDIERTNRFMGTSTDLWAEPLGRAGLLRAGESIFTFADYDYEKDDPVYGLGPLSGAKNLQRESMDRIRREHGVRTARICYPAVCTTALGAIPGGILMYALTKQILLERGAFQDLPTLAFGTMRIFRPDWDGQELRLDVAYQEALPEFHRRLDALDLDNYREFLERAFGDPVVP